MTNVITRRTFLTGLAVLLAPAALAHADEGRRERDRDHERAYRALRDGHARPLVQILEQVGDQLGGEIVGVEFEREKGRLIYEFKVITASGQLREVEVDAATGVILKSKDD